MATFILVAFGLSLAYALFQSAGVTPDWNWATSGVGAAAALFFGERLRRRRPGMALSPAVLILVVTLLALATISILPLPVSLIATLSPSRYQLLAEASPVLGPVPQYATLALVPLAAFQYLLTLGALVVTLVVTRDVTMQLRGSPWAWAPLWPLLILAGAEALLGIYQAYGEGGGTARGTFANRDHYAGFLELVFPLAVIYPLAILIRNRQRFESPAAPAVRACLIFGVAGLILVGIVHSLSRMAFIASLAALCLSALLVLYLRVHPVYAPVKVTLWRRLMPAVVIVAIALLGFVFLPTDPLIARFADLAMSEDISAATRAKIWADSVGIVKAFPLVGVGLGGYESAFYRFKTVAPMYTIDYAHNDFLQVLTEMGAVGFSVGLLLLLLILWSALSGALYSRDNDDRLMQIGAIGALTAILLHSFVDFNLYVPANAFTVAWIAGIAATHLTRVSKRRTAPA